MSVGKALEIAARAHEGQVDKGGHPYIEHPKAVAAHVEGKTEKQAALLHDVLEDSDITADGLLLEGFSDSVVTAVLTLTKQEGQTYESYLTGVKANEIARVVKLADLKHNMDLSRLGREPTLIDRKRLDKYRMAINYLM